MAGYLIKYGESVVYQAGDDERPVHDVSVSMRVDGVSTLTFTVPQGHALYDSLKSRGGMDSAIIRDMAHPIRAWFDETLLFCGFAVSVTENLQMERTVECVSDLQMLEDVLVRIDDHPQKNGTRRVYTSQALFAKVVELYNAAVAIDARKFAVGHVVTVGYMDSETNRLVVDAAATTPTSALGLLKSSIIDPYQCMLFVRYENGTRYLDMYQSAPSTSGQTIRFGENMTQYAVKIDTSGMYNCCLPLGGKRRNYTITYAEWFETTRPTSKGDRELWVRSIQGKTINAKSGDILVIELMEYTFAEDVDIYESGEYRVKIDGRVQHDLFQGYRGCWAERGAEYTTSTLTLTRRLDDGTYDEYGNASPSGAYRKRGEIVYDIESVRRYGTRMFTFTDQDILIATDLLAKAVSEIASKCVPAVTLQMDGVDMALYMDGYTHLVAGQKVRVESEPHHLSLTMQVTQADLSMDDPGATRYTIGPMPQAMTRRLLEVRNDARDVRDVLLYNIDDVVTSDEIKRLQ